MDSMAEGLQGSNACLKFTAQFGDLSSRISGWMREIKFVYASYGGVGLEARDIVLDG